ncbi:MAG: hypothetical protein QM767_04150 [Anaeromyxobacter sp.]
MNRNIVRAARCLALAALLIPVARAEEPILGSTSKADWPTEITRRPLTLNQGMAELWLPVNMNLSDGQEFEPVNLNPSLYYGITNEWMIGIRHFVGICASGEDQGCAETYDDVSVDTLLAFGRYAGVQFGIGGALNYAPIHEPSAWSAEAKLAIRAGGGAFAITLMPTVNFGLNDRDASSDLLPDGTPPYKWTGTPQNLGTYNVLTLAATPGNREYLLVPVTLQLQLGSSLALAVGASLNGPLNAKDLDFGDVYTIPVSVAAVVTPSRWLDLGAALTFPNLAGADFSSDTSTFTLANGTDYRQLALFATFRL